MIRPKVKPTGNESALLKKWGMYDEPKAKENKRGMIELENQIAAGELNAAPLEICSSIVVSISSTPLTSPSTQSDLGDRSCEL